MFVELLSAFRQATARPQRIKSDWALEVAQLLDTHSAKCETVTLVSDNLNTHSMGAFDEAFPPGRPGLMRNASTSFTLPSTGVVSTSPNVK